MKTDFNTGKNHVSSTRGQSHLHDSCKIGGRIEQPGEPHTLRCNKIFRPRAKLRDSPEHIHVLAQKILLGRPRQFLPRTLPNETHRQQRNHDIGAVLTNYGTIGILSRHFDPLFLVTPPITTRGMKNVVYVSVEVAKRFGKYVPLPRLSVNKSIAATFPLSIFRLIHQSYFHLARYCMATCAKGLRPGHSLRPNAVARSSILCDMFSCPFNPLSSSTKDLRISDRSAFIREHSCRTFVGNTIKQLGTLQERSPTRTANHEKALA